VTLFGPAWSDARLARIGRALHAGAGLPLGATQAVLPDIGAPVPTPIDELVPAGWLPLAVVGAHLSGQPLNDQLTSRGGRLWRKDRTAPAYRLFVLPNTTPAKPGLQRVPADHGASIEVEIWLLPAPAWADFVASVPLPHAIGHVQLADGSSVPGYLCEPIGLDGATDISRFGGWRRYRTAVSQGEIVA
jgi:allophanate hydrolase